MMETLQRSLDDCQLYENCSARLTTDSLQQKLDVQPVMTLCTVGSQSALCTSEGPGSGGDSSSLAMLKVLLIVIGCILSLFILSWMTGTVVDCAMHVHNYITWLRSKTLNFRRRTRPRRRCSSSESFSTSGCVVEDMRRWKSEADDGGDKAEEMLPLSTRVTKLSEPMVMFVKAIPPNYSSVTVFSRRATSLRSKPASAEVVDVIEDDEHTVDVHGRAIAFDAVQFAVVADNRKIRRQRLRAARQNGRQSAAKRSNTPWRHAIVAVNEGDKSATDCTNPGGVDERRGSESGKNVRKTGVLRADVGNQQSLHYVTQFSRFDYNEDKKYSVQQQTVDANEEKTKQGKEAGSKNERYVNILIDDDEDVGLLTD